MLQGFGQNSFLDFETTSHAGKTGTYFQRTFHSYAVSGLKKLSSTSHFLCGSAFLTKDQTKIISCFKK